MAFLFTLGFALLALGGILAVLSLGAAELENAAQATAWGTAAFGTGLLGAIAATVGAGLDTLRARRSKDTG